jgi:O-antigen ligase
MLMGFLPFALVPLHLNMAAISWPTWPGHVRGTEFSALDALALALYFSLPRSPHLLPFRLSMALYFFAALLSAVSAEGPVAALFYVWQLARMFLVYAVVTRGCANPRVPLALLMGMAAGLFMEAGVVLFQRFGLHMLQAVGTIGHQNKLGMITHFIVFPFFALMLAGRLGWRPAAVVVAGVVVEVLTTSRATLGLAGLGYATVFVLSALREWTYRKGLVLLIAVGAIVLLAPFALSSISHRGATQLEDSDDERIRLKSAAAMMLSDYPLGVGANNFVVVANTHGYYQRAGVAWASYSAHVHNVYWLVVAETGYLGLITYVLLLLQPLTMAFRFGWRNLGDQRSDLLLGLGVVLFIVYVHCLVEWVFISYEVQYMCAMAMGLVAGLAMQLSHQTPYTQGVRGNAKHGDRMKTLMDAERRLTYMLRRTGVPTERRVILDSIASIRNETLDIRKGTHQGRKQGRGVAPQTIPLPSGIALVMPPEESIERPCAGSSPPPATTSVIT